LVGQQILQAQVQRRIPSRDQAGPGYGPSLVRVAERDLAKPITTEEERKLCCAGVEPRSRRLLSRPRRQGRPAFVSDGT
jgi:hypothetical protein